MDDNKNVKSWWSELIRGMPLKKLTAAQVGNYIMDLFGLSMLGMYIATGPEDKLLAALIFAMLFVFIWCHQTSKPRSRL